MTVELIHKLSGRVRYRVASLRGSKALAADLERELRLYPGVLQAWANATTGTVLILFTGEGTAAGLAGRVEALAVEQREGAAAEKPASFRGRMLVRAEKSAQPWHLMAAGKVLRHFETSAETGLTAAEAQKRLHEAGPNMLPMTTSRSFGLLFRNQLSSLPMLLVLAAAGLSIVSAGAAEGVVVLLIAVANAAIGAVTENRAERTIDRVREAVDLRARILRDGWIEEIPFEQVVRGDIVDLQLGSRVPADLRLIEGEHLTVDEAALTGENIPVLKTSAAMEGVKDPISRRLNMLYRGTLVVEGQGRAVAVATGNETVIGRLQNVLGAVFPPEALVAEEIDRLSRHLIRVGGAAFGLFAAVSLLRGAGLLRIIRNGSLLFAGAIPAGLSTLFVSAFAFGHRDLLANRILVRRLRALGSLASIQVVCFDKTGTLTHNRMSAAEIFTAGRQIRIESKRGDTGADLAGWKDDPDLSWLVKLTILCNESQMLHEGGRSLEGSSTEIAFIHLARRLGIKTTEFRGDHPIEEIFHRTDQRLYMVTLHHWDRRRQLTAVKGSPLEVLERCTQLRKGGEAVALTAAERDRIETENFKMASRGLRVLGAAYRWGRDELASTAEPGGERLIWCGLVGLADPIRSGARKLVDGLHRAGIKTVVLTGDQSLTAQHIGKELDLSGKEPLHILDAREVAGFKEAGVESVVRRAHVFARLNPAQKLQIIQAYQKAGLTVLMVGDGFNDVLALKIADIGIAMGRNGADLARRTADLVLEDDNLESVLSALANGRTFYGNMQRSLKYLLAVSYMDVSSDLFIKSGVAGAGPSPLQNLWTSAAGLLLACDATDPELLNHPPIGVNEPLLRERDRLRAAADAAVLSGASLPTGAYALTQYGPNAAADKLFWRSISANQLLYVLTRREQNGRTSRKRPPSPLLHAMLWGVAASSMLSMLLGGTTWPRFILDNASIGASAWLSRKLLQPPQPKRSGDSIADARPFASLLVNNSGSDI